MGKTRPSIRTRVFSTTSNSWGLLLALRFRWVTVLVMLAGMGAAIYGFGFVTQSFFPPSKLTSFTVDYWLPQGSDIRETNKDMTALEEVLEENKKIKQITTTVGQGANVSC